MGKFFTYILSGFVLAVLPSSPNYKLNSYGVGTGGTANSISSTYGLEGITGEASGGTQTSNSLYKNKPGFIETQQAHVPKLTTFDNPSSYYDKLRFVVDEQGNPSDAKYALQISTDINFASGNNYIKADHTIGPTLVLGDYQTYSAWGSGTGTTIIGLASNTTYYLRVRATQGRFTESGWGPSSTTATVGQQLSFSLSTNAEALGALLPATVISSPTNVTATLSTNANAGANVYISGANGGLLSTRASTTITSATADLGNAGVLSGFGVIIASVGQTSGGPLAKVSPYNSTADNVGITDTTVRGIFTTTAPIVSGLGVFTIKAKASSTTPSSDDYSEILTVIAAAIF